MKRYGILGSGKVGQVLAEGLKKHGFEVRVGSRSPDKLRQFAKDRGMTAGTFAETAAWAEAIVLAVKGLGAEEALRLAGREHLEAKLVIDTTNPITDDPPVDGVLQYFTGPNDSLMERLQEAFPGARFVKAFNSVGSARMVDPEFSGGRPTMFYCGNDAEAKAEVARLLEALGWEPADMGTARSARAIEPLAMLWCIPGFLRNHWSHAFKVVWK
jgi:predicted dinucleotide-binding enzyme